MNFSPETTCLQEQKICKKKSQEISLVRQFETIVLSGLKKPEMLSCFNFYAQKKELIFEV